VLYIATSRPLAVHYTALFKGCQRKAGFVILDFRDFINKIPRRIFTLRRGIFAIRYGFSFFRTILAVFLLLQHKNLKKLKRIATNF